MPLQKLLFKPGVNREGTTLANEGGWFECDKVRFRSGFPEKIGGWSVLSYNKYLGTARSLWNWITLKNYNLLGVGTNLKFYVENGGVYYDITPIRISTGPSAPVPTTSVAFAATAGSYEITVTDAAAVGFQTGDYVTFSGATGINAEITAGVLNQEYEIIYKTSSTYTIYARAAGTSITTPGAFVTSLSTASGGGASANAAYQIAPGEPVYSVGTGWGTGPWSRGGWGSGYTTGIGQQLRLWSQSNFGERLLFCPRGGPFYVWDPGSAAVPAYTTRGTVVSGTYVPSLINQIMVSDASRITIAFGCNDPSGTYATTALDPMQIRWSDQESYTNWDPASSVGSQAGDYRLSHGSFIMGALQTRQEILVWTDSSVYSMQYLGISGGVYGFTLLADNISIASPNAMVTANGITYWMGIDKFYMYSGRVETLPSTLRQYVFGNINMTQSAQFFAGTNEGYSEVWWFYCSKNSNVIDRYVIFNYLDHVWYYGTLNRTAWLDSPLRPYPQAALGVQRTTLAATINSTATTIPVVSALSYPNTGVIQIDNELIAYTGVTTTSFTGCVRGYNNTIAASHNVNSYVTDTNTNYVVYHESAVDDGTSNPPSPIYSYIQSSDFDIGEGHNYGFVWQLVPDITFDGSTTPAPNYPNVDFIVRPRQNPGSNYGTANEPTVTSAQSYASQQTYNVQQFTEIVYTRIRGRQMAFKVDCNSLGTQWQLGAPRINLRADGRR
jgi:hypothetical protein